MKMMKKTLIVLFCMIVGFQMKTGVLASELSGKWEFQKIVIPAYYDDVYSIFSEELIKEAVQYWTGVYIEFENDTDYSMRTSDSTTHNTYESITESTMRGCDMYNLNGFNTDVHMAL